MGYAPELGYAATVLAFGGSLYAAMTAAAGGHWGGPELAASGRRALLAVAGLTTAAVVALLYSLVTHDFGLQYVWQTSSRATPLLYQITALWGGQAGSLLFWSWLLATLASLAAWRHWRADAVLLPWFTAITAAVIGFFLFLVAFVTNPFERLGVLPADGNGLNPLLQHPGMAFHPPALYLGFTAMTIPYAFAMAALITRQTDATWIQVTRRWLLAAWLCLSIGLALGGRWAYDVLGWGGYWSWDPVENAALMPWLAATAFVHSVIIQERRGMFRVWNMVLIILVFSLTIIGTFLTRAGLVASVHAFAQSPLGPYFLVFTAAIVIGSLLLLWRRLPDLRSQAVVESLVSRESAFLLNNLLFMGAVFAVCWGSLVPMVSEVLANQRVSVGPPYFNRVAVPMLWLVLLLMGIGPLVAWRRSDPHRLWQSVWPPALTSLVITVALFLLGVRQWFAIVGLAAAIFAMIVTLVEFWHGTRMRMRRGEDPLTALARLVGRNRRRYGGYLVHIGVVLLALGVIGSSVYRVEAEQTLTPGQTLRIGGFELTNRGLRSDAAPDKEAVSADLSVTRDGASVATLSPHRDTYYQRADQPVTVPAVLHRPLEDVYTLLATYDPASQQITVRALVVPLISLVWFGLAVVVMGTIVAAWPDAREQRAMNAELARLLVSTEVQPV
jgi:cytochrome c-type biogenesis protein CcmF